MTKLSDAKKGNVGYILKINGDRQFKRKLFVMGVLEGEKFLVEEVSPMGSPIVVSVKQAKIALRREEAENVIVDLS